jgi:hypothetical protein
MKSILLLIIIILSVVKSNAQQSQIDSLKIQIANLQTFQNKVELNLERCHQQYKSGLGLLGAGLIIGVVGVAATSLLDGVQYALIGVGGGFTIAGTAIIIDSHRYLGTIGTH